MNAPDLRNIDFDAYRRRAEALRAAAIDSAFDRASAALRSLFAPRTRQFTAPRRAPATHCAA